MTQDRSQVRTTGDTLYRSYLLRLWQEEPGGEHRAILQDVLSGESRSFSSLGTLVVHIATLGGPAREKGTAQPE